MRMRGTFEGFTLEDNATWGELYRRQWGKINENDYGHPWFYQGKELLGINGQMPDFSSLDKKLQSLVGWELISTPVQYSDGQEWFEHLARKEFLITQYIRDRENLDYTPLPDIWHDAFGHLPFMAIPEYARYIREFGLTAIQYTPEEREGLGNIWWYTIEFGFVEHGGNMKAFGAGLMSGYSELERSYSGHVEIVDYDKAGLEYIANVKPSPHIMHNTLFKFNSFESIAQAAKDWVKSTGKKWVEG